MTAYRYIDMEHYARKAHFDYFRSMAYPYVGLTANIDITDFLKNIKERELPFFLSILWCVAHAANDIPEFRQRIYGNSIIEFDNCPTSHTVARPDGTYCYCTLDCSSSFEEFLPHAIELQKKARAQGTIDERAAETLSYLYISTLPWLSFSALVQPVPSPADSNPRITWGRYFEQNGRTLLPLSVLCHHSLIDGLQIAQLYERIEQQTACAFPSIRLL